MSAEARSNGLLIVPLLLALPFGATYKSPAAGAGVAVGAGVGLAVGVGVGVGVVPPPSDTIMLSNFAAVLNAISPIAPEVRLVSVAVRAS
ncbi:hypothetical protein D3C79_988170 [compost metagenome]